MKITPEFSDFSAQNYWVSLFILLAQVIKFIERKCNASLWHVKDDCAIEAKVAWRDLTMPKQKGGLSIRKLKEWNSACILRNCA